MYVSGKLGPGGEHTFIRKTLKHDGPFVSLQSEVLIAFSHLNSVQAY